MKAISKVLSIVLVGCSLMSCQTRKGNVELTDFTRELISLYINDLDNLNARNRKDVIIIGGFTDTLHHYFFIFAVSRRVADLYYCEEAIGQTSYLGHLVRVFGNKNSIFYSIKDNIKIRKRCNKNDDIDIAHNPNVWQILLHKDMSFYKIHKSINNEDISAIENLVERFFGNVP